MAGQLAAVPAGSMVDPCCCVTCASKFGDTMEVTITDVQLCGCVRDELVMPNRYFYPFDMVDVNGVWTLNATLPGDPANTSWSAIIGTYQLQEYTSGAPIDPDNICTGEPIGDPFTVNVELIIICSNDFPSDPQGLQAQTPGAGIFFAGPFFQPGEVVPNDLTCAKTGSGYYDSFGGLGQLTVTPP